MKIEKAVITAAGKGQGDLPLQTLVDSDGTSRSALEILLREALDAGVKEVGLVICPEDETSYREAAGDCKDACTFLHQPEPLGYGHALLTAQDFVGPEAFLHLVGDHLYVSNSGKGCARQLVEFALQQNCSVSAVQATRETNLYLYGAMGGLRSHEVQGGYEIDCVMEKPTPTQAEQKLVVPGLRVGHYLCFFGLHVLSASVLPLLDRLLEEAEIPGSVSLSHALDALTHQEKVMACEVQGDRQNIGIPYGLFHAQLALALRGVDRAEVLSSLVQTLAEAQGPAA